MKDFLLASFVVALRMPILMREAQRLSMGKPASGGRAESERMVTEKIVAMNEGVLQAAVEISRLHVELGMLALQGNGAGFFNLAQTGPERIAKAAHAPSGKRVRSNARRLAAG